jgi:hypothetical protein
LAAQRFWFIMHRAAKAPCRRRPVSSTLGCGGTSPWTSRALCHCQQAQAGLRIRLLVAAGIRSLGVAQLQGGPSAASCTRALRAYVRLRRQSSSRQLGAAVHCSPTAASARHSKLNATTTPLAHCRARRPRHLSLRAAPATANSNTLGPILTLRPRDRSLTRRSTGAPTAGHLGREALLVHHAPRGQGALPSSPG